MINIHLEIRGLGSEWLDGTNLTGKSLSLLIEIDEEFKDKKAKNDKELMGDDFKKMIEEYRELFPNRKLASGKYARDNVKNLEAAFKWFFKNHEYDWTTIHKSTKRYVREYKEKDYEFMRTSKYFIKKQDKDGSTSSDLANYCEMVIKGEGDSDTGDMLEFAEKVV